MYSRGHLCAAIREIASASRTIAFSSLGTEPWPARPRAVQPQPGDALLGGLQQVGARARPVAVGDGDAVAADLADRLGDALEELGVVLDDVVRPLDAAGLLVGEERDDQVARRLGAGRGRGGARWPGSSRPCPSCRPRRGPRRSRRAPRRRTGRPASRRRSPGTTSRWPCTHRRRAVAVLALEPDDHAGPARVALEDRAAPGRPRAAARRRTRRPRAPPARCRRRSWWCRSGSAPGRCGRPRRQGWWAALTGSPP